MDQKEIEKQILKQKIINHIIEKRDEIKNNLKLIRTKENSSDLNNLEA